MTRPTLARSTDFSNNRTRPRDSWTANSAAVVEAGDLRAPLSALARDVEHSAGSPYLQPDVFLAAAAGAASALPSEIAATLDAIRIGTCPGGAALIRGLPLDRDLCATPTDPVAPEGPHGKGSFVSEAILSLAASRLGGDDGGQVGFLQESAGLLWQQIVPRQDHADLQTSLGYRTRLEYHTETAFHPNRPAFLLLFALRGDRDGAASTLYTSVDDLLEFLEPEDLAELFLPQFRLGIDASFGGGTMPSPAAVLEETGGAVRLRYDADLMHARTDAAARALARIKLVAVARQRSVVLEAGDMLVVDNRRAIHGRSSFTPRHDGLDRWLQRAFVAERLPRSQDMLRGSRVITGPLPRPAGSRRAVPEASSGPRQRPTGRSHTH